MAHSKRSTYLELDGNNQIERLHKRTFQRYIIQDLIQDVHLSRFSNREKVSNFISYPCKYTLSFTSRFNVIIVNDQRDHFGWIYTDWVLHILDHIAHLQFKSKQSMVGWEVGGGRVL